VIIKWDTDYSAGVAATIKNGNALLDAKELAAVKYAREMFSVAF